MVKDHRTPREVARRSEPAAASPWAGASARTPPSQPTDRSSNRLTGPALLGPSSPIDRLEQAGRLEEAIRACLGMGDVPRAARLLAKAPGVDRVLAAQVHLAAGRPIEAGQLFAAVGLVREAAAAFEGGRQWAWAASRWEAAQDFEHAAEVYRKAKLPREASRCLQAAKRPLAAAELLIEAGDRTGAAQLLLRLERDGPDAAAATLLLIPLLLAEKLYSEVLDRIARLPAAVAASADDRRDWEARAREGLRQLAALPAYPAKTALERQPATTDSVAPAVEVANAAVEAPVEPTVELRPPAAPRIENEPVLALGQVLAGRYELVAELGQGGMGRVFKARDRDLGGFVAIKALHCAVDNDRGAPERLLREVQIGRRIDHPNVVRVFDFGRAGRALFLVLELLEGVPLDSLVRPGALLPLPRVRGLLADTAAGLAAAHGVGVVHRDLKPSNLMVTAERVKILDFGIAHLLDADRRLTQTGFAVGSVLYMSPEQLYGQPLDHRVDLYALGIVAHTLLTGAEPFDGTNPTAIAVQHMQKAPPDPRRERPDLPVVWVQMVAKLLAKSRDDRYQTAQEVLQVIRGLPVVLSCPETS